MVAIATTTSGAALADDAAALAALDAAFASVAEMPDTDKGPARDAIAKKVKGHANLASEDLAYYASQAICKYNTASKARAKFDELDVDKSGSLDGTELNKVVQWMFTMTADGPVSTEEEEEAKQLMLERIDTSKNQKLSFDEFLVLFEEEQRKSMMIKYAKQKFSELDANQSGNLDNQEINKLVSWLLDLTEEEFTQDDKELIKVELMARVGDVQSDGSTVVTYDNFVLLCEEEMERVELRRRARDKFMELDKDHTGVLERDELYKGACVCVWCVLHSDSVCVPAHRPVLSQWWISCTTAWAAGTRRTRMRPRYVGPPGRASVLSHPRSPTSSLAPPLSPSRRI